MDGTVVTLKEHLGNACRGAEVAIDLEWRMGVKQVGIGASVGILRGDIVGR